LVIRGAAALRSSPGIAGAASVLVAVSAIAAPVIAISVRTVTRSGRSKAVRQVAGEASSSVRAVGSLVGQIARIKRCRAIGIAGTDQKVRFLVDELGFDAAFNYRETPDYDAKLKELCPNGVDVYFDNVGGPITDAVMRRIGSHARVAVCGQISQYNAVEPEMGPRWLSQLVIRQAKVEGFLVTQFADRYEAGLHQLSTWLKEKRLYNSK